MGSGVKYDRASFPKSTIGTAVTRLTHRAPFASTLRPNLTGGALPRTAGGYSIGVGRTGGARYFSHTPAAPAQVVNNVSAAVRAFWLSGQKAQFDGVSPRSGEKRYKSVTALQAETGRKIRSIPRATPGSSVDFQVSPTITALGSLQGLSGFSSPAQALNAEGLMHLLSVDFARAFKDLAIIMNDIKRLSTLGDLPVGMADSSTLRVHFPGCDAQTVERLCDEVGVQRGIIRQDAAFDISAGTDIALLFPFAPSTAPSVTSYAPLAKKAMRLQSREEVDWRNMISPDQTTVTSPGFSNHSDSGLDFADIDVEAAEEEENPWLSPSLSGYSSMHSSDAGGEEYYFSKPSVSVANTNTTTRKSSSAEEYEGLEGIYRFLEQCDGARR